MILQRMTLLLAAVMAVVGILIYAAAAHATDGPGGQAQFSLSTGALMLLTHAPVLIGVVAISDRARWPAAWALAAITIGLANGLFAASVSLPHLSDYDVTLPAGAGPVSAFILIGGWAAFAVLALIGLRRGAQPSARD
ncbi:MAG: hypothetical protein AAFV26_09890 [Pseudomonadota bacterium]